MRVTLTSETFTEIAVTKGTVQNLSPQASIEIVTTETKDSGIVLFPRQTLTFSNDTTIYARSVWDTVADGEIVILAVEPIFNAAGGGGESYTLPIATASKLGGIKVGNNLSIDPDTGVLDATETPYILPAASDSVLGGVKVGTNLTIDGSGVLSADAAPYTLPKASASVLGGIKVGNNLIIDADTGVLSAVGGSSMLPHITVTAPTGCTVTVRQGTTVLTATEVSGTWDFELESFGYWTVKCEKPGDSSVYTEKRVLISTVSDYLIGMDYAYRYGYKIKKSESNPSTRVEYTHMAVGMTPAHMNYTDGVFDYGSWGDVWFVKENKPCMLKSNGTVDYYLDPNNYAFKADGVTPSDVANTSYDGNAMSEIPLCWVYRYEDNEYLYEVVCNVQYDANYKAYAHTKADGTIANAFYFGMFGGSGDSTKIRSLSGQSLVRGLTRQQECDACVANGTGWYTGTWSQWCLIQTLLVLMGKSTDTQTAFGKGNADNAAGRGEADMLTTGTLDDRGQFWGYSTTMSQIKAFHIEKLWGDQLEAVAGLMNYSGNIYVKMTPEGQGYRILDVTGYTNTGISISASGFISTARCSDSGIIPSGTSGSGTTYYCDYALVNNNQMDYLVVGYASYHNSAWAGSFSFDIADSPSNAVWSRGARPSYI